MCNRQKRAFITLFFHINCRLYQKYPTLHNLHRLHIAIAFCPFYFELRPKFRTYSLN